MRCWLLLAALTAIACGEASPEGSGATGSGGGQAGSEMVTGSGGAGAGQGGAGAQAGAPNPDDCASIVLTGQNQVVTLPGGCPSPSCESTGLTPLDALGGGDFLGVPGGLYCNGANERPTHHAARGLELGQGIAPRAFDGSIDAQAGKVVLVSIGMSNTSQEFGAFINNHANQTSERVVLVNGALGGQASEAWSDSELPWNNLDQVLANASLSHAQVAAVWIKLTHLEGYSVCGNDPPFQGPVACFPAGAAKLYDDMVVVLQRVKTTFPNVAIAYLSGRVYGGYANGGPSPEPFAYGSSFAMKALILDQITGENPELAEPLVPWLSWGPYLWADGLIPRDDGLTWTLADFESDGIHPSTQGRAKVAGLLWDFFSSDTTATPWFLD